MIRTRRMLAQLPPPQHLNVSSVAMHGPECLEAGQPGLLDAGSLRFEVSVLKIGLDQRRDLS
jgi:hypothetical protein